MVDLNLFDDDIIKQCSSILCSPDCPCSADWPPACFEESGFPDSRCTHTELQGCQRAVAIKISPFSCHYDPQGVDIPAFPLLEVCLAHYLCRSLQSLQAQLKPPNFLEWAARALDRKLLPLGNTSLYYSSISVVLASASFTFLAVPIRFIFLHSSGLPLTNNCHGKSVSRYFPRDDNRLEDTQQKYCTYIMLVRVVIVPMDSSLKAPTIDLSHKASILGVPEMKGDYCAFKLDGLMNSECLSMRHPGNHVLVIRVWKDLVEFYRKRYVFTRLAVAVRRSILGGDMLKGGR